MAIFWARLRSRTEASSQIDSTNTTRHDGSSFANVLVTARRRSTELLVASKMAVRLGRLGGGASRTYASSSETSERESGGRDCGGDVWGLRAPVG